MRRTGIGSTCSVHGPDTRSRGGPGRGPGGWWSSLSLAALLAFGAAGACQRGDGADSSTTPGEEDRHSPKPATTNDERSPLDAAIEASWQGKEIDVAPRSEDGAFIRRVSLDLLGRTPTPNEVQAFVEDARADKRARLVDAMLASPEYASYWSEVYAKLLLGQDKIQTRARNAFEDWLEGELDAGSGWDQLATDMVTARGELGANPQGVFIASHLRQSGPELLTGSLTRKFLGVQIECAQCHDHPYSDFTREDFYGMSAFFVRTKVQRSGAKDKVAPDDMSGMSAMSASKKRKQPKYDFSITERERGEMRIKPKDAQGNEGDRKVKIAPAFLGEEVELAPRGSRRRAFAAQMIESPLFEQAAVGFVWTQLLGRGLQDPWDELGDAAQARPPALTWLAENFAANEHDLRWLLRTIVLSDAYQRASLGSLDAESRLLSEQHFARAAVRPMRAEQLFRSLLETTGLEAVGGKSFKRIVQSKKNQALAEYTFIFADDEAQHVDSFTGSVPQALLLLNGGLTNEGVMRRPGSSLDRILQLDGFEARLEALYVLVYARAPSEAEAERARTWLEGGGDEAWEDLFFAMLNSTEFTSNH